MPTQPTEQFEILNRWTRKVQFTAHITCAPDATIGIKIGLAAKWARQSRANLRDADLRAADLRRADLRAADLRRADLSAADLSAADLRRANLSGADLRGADLSDADLSGADLSGADLRRADLSAADLSGADLRRADLSDADLRRADLRGADLRRADLSAANLSPADLRSFKADFWMILVGAQNEVPGLIAALKDGRVNGSSYHGDCACLVGTIANVRGVSVDTLEKDSERPAERWFMMINKGDKPDDDTGGGFAAAKALQWAEEFVALTTPAKVQA